MSATHIEVYLFTRAPRLKLLLLRRSGHDSLPGVWQPVTGRIHAREKALAAAAREVREESGLPPSRWWRLEHVVSYVNPLTDELRVVALFAAEVAPGARVMLSDEHDAYRWVTPAAAAPLVLWDTQRAALQALRRQVLGPARLADALEIPMTRASRPQPVAPRTRRTRRTRRRRG